MKKYIAKKIEEKKFDEHRLVMEKHLNRKLESSEVVHHKDRDRSNNKITNLQLFESKSKHTSFHLKNGDLKLACGKNKKKLINGKLKCCNCKKLKSLDKFESNSKSYLGVIGTCKECRNSKRRVSPLYKLKHTARKDGHNQNGSSI